MPHPKHSVGVFSSMARNLAGFISLRGPAWVDDIATVERAFSSAVSRIGALGFESVKTPVLKTITPGVAGAFDAIAESAVEALSMQTIPGHRNALRQHRQSSPWSGASLMTFRNEHILGSMRNGSSPAVMTSVEEPLFCSEMREAGFSAEAARAFSIGHELAHWIWQEDSICQTAVETMRQTRPLVHRLVELASEPQIPETSHLCGLSAHAWLHIDDIRHVADETLLAVDEAFADMMGALATDNPVRAWDAIGAMRKRDSIEGGSDSRESSAPKYRGLSIKCRNEIRSELSLGPDKERIVSALLPTIAQSCADSLGSWLLGTPGEGPDKSTVRAHLLASAASGIELGLLPDSSPDAPWPAHPNGADNSPIERTCINLCLTKSRIAAAVAEFSHLVPAAFPFHVQDGFADTLAEAAEPYRFPDGHSKPDHPPMEPDQPPRRLPNANRKPSRR